MPTLTLLQPQDDVPRFPDTPDLLKEDRLIRTLIKSQNRRAYGTSWLRHRYGRCYEIGLAVFLSGRLPAGSALVHGDCLCLHGPTHRTTPEGTCGTLRFEHGWIQLPDHSVWDPVNCEVVEGRVWQELRRPCIWHLFTDVTLAEQAAIGPAHPDGTRQWCTACENVRPKCWRCGRTQRTTAELCRDCGAEIWCYCANCGLNTDPEAIACTNCNALNPWARL